MPCRVVDNVNKNNKEIMVVKVGEVVMPIMVRDVLVNDDMVLVFNSYAEANHYSYRTVSVRDRDPIFLDSLDDWVLKKEGWDHAANYEHCDLVHANHIVVGPLV